MRPKRGMSCSVCKWDSPTPSEKWRGSSTYVSLPILCFSAHSFSQMKPEKETNKKTGNNRFRDPKYLISFLIRQSVLTFHYVSVKLHGEAYGRRLWSRRVILGHDRVPLSVEAFDGLVVLVQMENFGLNPPTIIKLCGLPNTKRFLKSLLLFL